MVDATDDKVIIEAFKKMPLWQKVAFIKNCSMEVEEMAKALEVRTRRVEMMTRIMAEENKE